MAIKRTLPLTFPHRLVLIISLLLGICSLATITLGVFSLLRRIWGYYLATGLWCGGVVLLTAIAGAVCTHNRVICSVKTFMIFAIFGAMTSLAMVALSAGGLDPVSGFYQDAGIRSTPSHHFITKIVHGSLLGLAIVQLSLCVVSEGVCIYYVFVAKDAVLFSVTSEKNKSFPGRVQKKSRSGARSSRSSTDSRLPLFSDSSATKHSKKKRSKQGERRPSGETSSVVNETSKRRVSPRSSRRNSANEAGSPRNICARSSSFTTFGRGDTSERESLIVHPDTSTTPERNAGDTGSTAEQECHYAQSPLFHAHIPIEEDEELPPYEPVDSNPYYNVTADCHPQRGRRRKVDHEDVDDETPLKVARSNGTNGQTGSAPHLSETDKEETEAKRVSRRTSSSRKGHRVSGKTALGDIGQTHSMDILSSSPEYAVPARDVGLHGDNPSQGVAFRDFAHSSDTILNPESPTRPSRSQSLKSHRERRLDRRKRALSAEIKLNKDQIIAQGKLDPEMRTRSIDFSNSAFADKRLRPTKFSLRTPVGASGSQNLHRSAVPVRAVTLPRRTAPPKPPRIHSYTREDSTAAEMESDEEGEDVVFVSELEEVKTIPPVKEAVVEQLSYASKQTPNLSDGKVKTDRTDSAVLEETKLQNGPLLTCALPSNTAPPLRSAGDTTTLHEAKQSTETGAMKRPPLLKNACVDNDTVLAPKQESPEIADIIPPLVDSVQLDIAFLPPSPCKVLPEKFSTNNHETKTSDKATEVREEPQKATVDDGSDAKKQQSTEQQTESSDSRNTPVIPDSDENKNAIEKETKSLPDTKKQNHGKDYGGLENLRVSLPPLSSLHALTGSPPSERILQKYQLSGLSAKQGYDAGRPTAQEFGIANLKPVTSTPSHVSPRLSSDKYNGARPKTVTTKPKPKVSEKPVPSKSSHIMSTKVLTTPSSHIPVVSSASVSKATSPTFRLSNKPAGSKPSNLPVAVSARGPLASARLRGSPSQSARAITHHVPSSMDKETGSSPVSMQSQGVLRLQQSPFQRQLSEGARPGQNGNGTGTRQNQNEAGLDGNPPPPQAPNPVAALNNVQQQNNNEPPRPLFSVLL